MKKILLLTAVLLLAISLNAQHKNMTIYHTGGTKTVVDVSATDSIVIFICGASKVSYGGKDYNTVLIGNQCWFKENLDVGTMMSGSADQTDNSIIEKYCYDNNTANCALYGGLYQWNEAMQYVTTEGARGICPEGWHVPTRAQFITLSDFVGWLANALRREDQGINSTNTSGFSGLYAGFRDFSYFTQLATHVYFWSTTPDEYGYAYMSLSNYANPYFNSAPGYCGTSIRCLKDN